ncbi:hypothetical protein [Bradyrhizobium sp. JR3.5]
MDSGSLDVQPGCFRGLAQRLGFGRTLAQHRRKVASSLHEFFWRSDGLNGGQNIVAKGGSGFQGGFSG